MPRSLRTNMKGDVEFLIELADETYHSRSL